MNEKRETQVRVEKCSASTGIYGWFNLRSLRRNKWANFNSACRDVRQHELSKKITQHGFACQARTFASEETATPIFIHYGRTRRRTSMPWIGSTATNRPGPSRQGFVPDIHAADAAPDLGVVDQPSRILIARFFKNPVHSCGVGPGNGVSCFYSLVRRFLIETIQ